MPTTSYYPICNNENPAEFFLVPTTLKNYKKIRLLTLKSTNASMETKLQIINEFKLETSDINDSLGIEEYNKELFLALFLGAQKFTTINPDVLDMGVISRAVKDFFWKLEGN